MESTELVALVHFFVAVRVMSGWGGCLKCVGVSVCVCLVEWWGRLLEGDADFVCPALGDG